MTQLQQLQQLQKDLIEGGLVAHLDDDNIMLVGHRSRSITREDILKALHDPEQLHNLSLTEKDGIVIIYPRRRREGNTRGPIATDRSKIVRPEIGPILDQDVLDWLMSMSKEARAMQWTYRYEDWHRDQLEALERSMGND